jgi:outer membrane protein assembly factor BamB
MSMPPQFPGHGAQGPGAPVPGRYGPPPGSYPPQGPAPGTPWHAQPPPGTPPPGRRGRRIAVTVIVAIVLVAAAGGVWFWTSGGGGGSKSPDTPTAKDYDAAVESVGAAEVAWQVEQGVAPEAVGVDDYWVTEEHLVRRLPGRVVAYELKTGKVAWEFQVGKVSDGRCTSSLEHSNLRVALLVSTGSGTSSACEKLVVLDIGTGKEVSTADLPPIGSTKVGAVPVVFGENVIIPSDAGTRVLDINSGAVRQMPNPESACRSREAALFGDILLADAVCSEEDHSITNRLRAFDANLKLLWEWTTPKRADGQPLDVVGVLSLDPFVVELSDSEKTQLLRVDRESGESVQMKGYDGLALREGFMSACDGFALRRCELAKVVDNKVILMTIMEAVNPDTPGSTPGFEATEHRNELVAFDLDTGEEAWRTGIVTDRLLGLVPGTAGDDLVAYQPSTLNGTKAIVHSVDPGTGKLSPLMPIGPKAHENEQIRSHVMAPRFGGDNHQAMAFSSSSGSPTAPRPRENRTRWRSRCPTDGR